MTTLVGSPGLTGAVDGVGSAARFYQPISAAVDAAGNLIVAEYANATIRKVVVADGTVTTVAGLAGKTGATDGSGTGGGARFRYPTAITVDASGNLYVSDQYNAAIRNITPEGVVSTLAGAAEQFGSADGVGSAARFNYPFGITVTPRVRCMSPIPTITRFAASRRTGRSARWPGFQVRVDSPTARPAPHGSNSRTASPSTRPGRSTSPIATTIAFAGLRPTAG